MRFLSGLARAEEFLGKFKPDIIHGHCFHSNLFARTLGFMVPRCVAISTIHNVYEGGRLRMLAYRATDRLCMKTVAVSRVAAERYVGLKAVPAAKMTAIANGIDVVQFLPNRMRREAMRRELNLDSDGRHFVWLASGRVARAKDYPNLLYAFARVSSANADARLYIAGGRTATVFEECRALTHSLNLDDSVEWLGLRRDIPALLDAADGFVSSSAWEGMPLAIAEAMAMEKPVVATDVGGVNELVGDAGVIVPPKNAGALAGAMLDVMQQSREFRDQLGLAARRRIAAGFNIHANADAWERLYESLESPHSDPVQFSSTKN